MKLTAYTNNYILKLDSEIQDETFERHFIDGIFKDDNAELCDFETDDDSDNISDIVLESDDDYNNAIKLYEHYKFSRVEASNRGLWTYLSLNTFAEYNKKNFNIYRKNELKHPDQYIYDHYVLEKSPSGMMRHTLCGLWWAVQLSVDEEREDKYELTKILFKQKSFYARFFPTNLISMKPAVQGILEFMQENQELFQQHFENRMRVVTTVVNRIGGTKNLCYMDKEFFKSELNNYKDLIEKVVTRNDYRALL